MREFSKVSPTVWKSRKFRALKADSDARLVYLYILTNPHVNSAGCYDLPIAYACADLEWEIKRYREAIERVSRAGLILADENETTVFVTNWIRFNSPTNPKHALGMLDQLEEASSGWLKSLRCKEIRDDVEARQFHRNKEVGAVITKAIERILRGYAEGIPTKTETESERETENETKTKIEIQTQKESIDENDHGVRAAAPDGAAHPPHGGEPESTISHLLDTPLMRRTSR